jgi:hypothetical protein
MTSQGHGADSDWRCSPTRSYTGQIEADNNLTIELNAPYHPGGCMPVSGSNRTTGRMTSADSITFGVTGRAVCQMFLGDPTRTQEVDFNLTFTLTRWIR